MALLVFFKFRESQINLHSQVASICAARVTRVDVVGTGSACTCCVPRRPVNFVDIDPAIGAGKGDGIRLLNWIFAIPGIYLREANDGSFVRVEKNRCKCERDNRTCNDVLLALIHCPLFLQWLQRVRDALLLRHLCLERRALLQALGWLR